MSVAQIPVRLALTLMLLFAARPSRAQDFAGAGPRGPGGALELLEHALPAAQSSLTAAAATTRWWGMRELETRALALGAGWRTVLVAAGLSQTGAPELGWTTLALAAGGATRTAGAALRVATRQDRDVPWSATRALAPGMGVDLGAGAWLEPVAGWRVWASAPQVVAYGGTRPLERPLEVGVRAGRGTGGWCTLRAPRAHDDGERSLGVCVAVAPLAAWAEVRDGPLRGAAGVHAGAGPIALGVRVDAHPVLGETVRVELSWSSGRGSGP